MLTLCLWYLAPTPQCLSLLSVTPKSGNFSWIGGGGQVYLVAAGCREGYGTTSIITRQPTSVRLDEQEVGQRREGHLRPSASGGPTGSAAAGPSGVGWRPKVVLLP